MIIEFHKKQLKLYKGKLPFMAFPGKADEKEKITIYEQALRDIIGLLRSKKDK